MNISKNVSINLNVTEDIRENVVLMIMNNVSALVDEHGYATRETYFNMLTTMVLNLGNDVNHPKFGKYTKRIRKQFKKTFGIQLEDTLIASIGKYLSERTGSQTLHVVISEDLCFEEGIFGDNGACFHNGRSWSKALLMELDANVMFIFSEDGVPLSRNWIIPTEDNGYLLINLYNNRHQFMSFYVGSQCFKNAIGSDIEPKEIKVLWRDLYVNGSLGWLLLTIDMTEISIPITVDCLKYKKSDYATCKTCGELIIASQKKKCPNCKSKIRRKVCCNCDESVDEDNSREIDGQLYCDECFDRLFSYCDCCNEYHDVDYFYCVGNEYVCENCYQEYYSTCDHCHEIHYRDNMTVVNDEYVCEYCLERHYDLCNHCNEYFPKNEGILYDSEVYCEECSDKLFLFCYECNEVINPKYDEYYSDYKNGKVGNETGHVYCENCRDNLFEQCEDCKQWFELKDFEELEVDGVMTRKCFHCFDEILARDIA
jgi:formylmethanofuran dehydrogenase subunit E